MTANAHLSNPDPDFVAALNSIGGRLPRTFPDDVLFNDAPFDFPASREAVSAMIAPTLVNAPDQLTPSLIKRKDLFIDAEDGFVIDAEAYIPTPNAELGEDRDHLFPLFCWLHGGDRISLEKIAIERRVSVLNIGYRLAPEHPFPTGLNDAYTVLKWANALIINLKAARNAQSTLRADLSKGFVIGGQSAGANLAAAICHMARDDPTFSSTLSGQLYQIPGFIHPQGIPDKFKDDLYSRVQNADDLVLGGGTLDYMTKCYAAIPTDTRMSPLLLSSFKDLPPAYIQVCGGDILRDDGFLYQKLLHEAGIAAKLEAYPGVPHGFYFYFPRLISAIKFWEDTSSGLEWLLNGAK